MTNDEKYLVGEGPALFEISPVHENFMVIDFGDGEPIEAPRFLLNDVPEELRSQVYDEHGELPMQSIIEAGIGSLEWRQRPPHIIEWDLISEDVFGALKKIAPGSVSSLGTIRLGWFNDRVYHAFKFHGFPEDDLLGDLDNRDQVLLADSDPPFEPVERRSVYMSVTGAEIEAREAGRPAPVIALPTWMARDDKIIHPGKKTKVVTEGFLTQWRETDISRMLIADNYEHDFYFRPWTYGARYQGGIPYKWVSVPD